MPLSSSTSPASLKHGRRYGRRGRLNVGCHSRPKGACTEWDKGSGSDESTESLRQLVAKQAASSPTFIAIDRGDAREVLAGPVKKLEGCYESPFQAHATMEPMNTTVHVRDNEIEVWSPTQFADEVQDEIAKLSGFPLDQVIVHMTLSGGSFGRRYQWDYAAEAWKIAKEIKKPVQLLWSREDDMQHDFYRPHNYQRVSGGSMIRESSSPGPPAWSLLPLPAPISIRATPSLWRH